MKDVSLCNCQTQATTQILGEKKQFEFTGCRVF